MADELSSLKSSLSAKTDELKESRKAYREAQDEIAQITDK